MKIKQLLQSLVVPINVLAPLTPKPFLFQFIYFGYAHQTFRFALK
jgi:hypothetical protein